MKGRCHCGAVEVEVTLSDGLKTARRCDCSFCRRRGAIAVSARIDGLRVVKGADNLTLYQWGTRTARHFFCKTCGIEGFAFGEMPDGSKMAAVNVNVLDGVDPREIAARAHHHDGRST